MGAPLSEPSPDGILHNLKDYDLRPMSIAKEKVVTGQHGSMTASVVATIIGRMREKKIPISSIRRAFNIRADWLLGLYTGRQRDVYLSQVLEVMDRLDLEVVIRVKSDGRSRSARPGSLKAVKLLQQAQSEPRMVVEPEPKVIIVEVDRPAGRQSGPITDEMRADIDRMLAS